MVSAAWGKTTLGPAIVVKVASLSTTFLPTLDPVEKSIRAATLSLWEGLAGNPPSGRIARWRWNRGAKRLHNDISKAVTAVMAEEDALSA